MMVLLWFCREALAKCRGLSDKNENRTPLPRFNSILGDVETKNKISRIPCAVQSGVQSFAKKIRTMNNKLSPTEKYLIKSAQDNLVPQNSPAHLYLNPW